MIKIRRNTMDFNKDKLDQKSKHTAPRKKTRNPWKKITIFKAKKHENN